MLAEFFFLLLLIFGGTSCCSWEVTVGFWRTCWSGKNERNVAYHRGGWKCQNSGEVLKTVPSKKCMDWRLDFFDTKKNGEGENTCNNELSICTFTVYQFLTFFYFLKFPLVYNKNLKIEMLGKSKKSQQNIKKP